MTVQRDPGSVEDRLYESIRDIPGAVLEKATGGSLDVLYKASNPNDPRRLEFLAAARVDGARLAQGLPALFAPLFETTTRETLARLGGPKSKACLLELVGAASLTHAEALKCVLDGIADGELSVRELRDADNEAAEAEQAISAVRRRIAEHMAAFPRAAE